MKQLSFFYKHMTVLFLSFMLSVKGLGQNSLSNTKDIEVEITNIDSGPFYAQLWFWIVIGIVFLLLLIVLIRGSGGKKDEKEENKEK